MDTVAHDGKINDVVVADDWIQETKISKLATVLIGSLGEMGIEFDDWWINDYDEISISKFTKKKCYLYFPTTNHYIKTKSKRPIQEKLHNLETVTYPTLQDLGEKNTGRYSAVNGRCTKYFWIISKKREEEVELNDNDFDDEDNTTPPLRTPLPKIQFKIGDYVKHFSISDPFGAAGIIKHIGYPPFAEDEIVGIELDEWCANTHDGSTSSNIIFDTLPGRGTFARRNKIEKFNPEKKNWKRQRFN
ncbi:hypothetical protein RFI_22392 [Reticulomyxa filosa]|uniref:CAP-Gly domain-containing protein n=1 Tax=Reticulomyxa filosa TaxID=46433 RepID=X6MMV0_RETFI|nr:hypothetical protein RFI_22392 [Reticulomyxa filosa]|eukprot:ETO14976.1 hypothetical protein RFI_22392 [Reticulomyxa filosa]